MSNLPQPLRRRLGDNFCLSNLKLASSRESLDGTKKFLFKLPDDKFIEAVNIPVEKRLTGCISSQAGCKFGCVFCASGALGFKRNLSSPEILDQIAAARKKGSVTGKKYAVYYSERHLGP